MRARREAGPRRNEGKHMGKLDGKVALITGGAGGQGSAEARLMAAHGATVIIADLSDEGLERVRAEIAAGGGAVATLKLNVADAASWRAAAEWIQDQHGGLDVLVNNAGILSLANIVELEEDEWDRVISVNQKGVWLGMKYCAPLMKARGKGSIINTSSIYAHIGSGGAVAYQASKGAVYILSRTAAAEFAPYGIRVNSVEPGFIDTAMTADVIAQYGDEHPDITRSLLKRAGTAEEIANGVLFLASDDSAFMTGTELLIDGGRSIS